MGQRAAKKWERRAGPGWRAERLARRQKKRFTQSCDLLKAMYAQDVPGIMADLRAYGAACRRLFGSTDG